MKKSILYTCLATVLAISFYFLPSLYGTIRLNSKNEAMDPLSKLWMRNKNIQLTNPYPNNIRVLKIEGSGNQLGINILKGKNMYYSNDVYQFSANISNDTLYIKTKGKANFLLHNSGNLEKLIIEEATGTINYKLDKENFAVVLNDSAKIELIYPQQKEMKVPCKHLQLELANKSNLGLYNGNIEQIDARLENSELTIANNIATDTARVNLVGRSVLKSAQPGHLQEVKTLIIQGDQQYFKKTFMGKGLSIVSIN